MKNALEQIGLSENEAACYTALLKLGASTITPIARKTKIKRTSIYNFIDNLVELGLVSVTTKHNRHYYQAENPEIIKRLLEENNAAIESALPELTNLYNQTNHTPTTKLFTGINGVKTVLENVLTSKKKKLFTIIDLDSAISNLDVKYWEQYNDRLTKAGIITQSLRHIDFKKRASEYKYLKKSQYQKLLINPRYLPEDIKLENTVFIYDNTVVILSPKSENWSMVIESKSLANTYRVLFKNLWQQSN